MTITKLKYIPDYSKLTDVTLDAMDEIWELTYIDVFVNQEAPSFKKRFIVNVNKLFKQKKFRKNTYDAIINWCDTYLLKNNEDAIVKNMEEYFGRIVV